MTIKNGPSTNKANTAEKEREREKDELYQDE